MKISSPVLNLRADIRKILFKTRNSQFWIKEPYHFRKDFTAFTSDGAEFLAQRNYELVGIDSFSISVFDDMINPHKILMENNTVVLENADLHLVNPGIYTFNMFAASAGWCGSLARSRCIDRLNTIYMLLMQV